MDFDLILKLNSRLWIRIIFLHNVGQAAQCTTLCLFNCGVMCPYSNLFLNFRPVSGDKDGDGRA
jgi:hypothetical protein